MQKKDVTLLLINTLLIALFSYAAFSKLMDYERAQLQMRGQVFTRAIADILTWAIPTLELILVAILLFFKTKSWPYWTSFILLCLFTLYIATIMTGYFGVIPCSCGGILEKMSYKSHIVFNLFFILVSGYGILLTSNKGKFYTWFNQTERR